MAISSARPTIARRLLAAALGLLMASGCSFVSVHRPRSRRAIEDPRVRDDCTARSAAPIVDTVLAGAGLAAGVIAYINAVGVTAGPDRDRGSPDLAVALLGTGAIFTASAIHGHLSTGKCRRRARIGEWCADGDLDACQRLKPGWTPPAGWFTGPTLPPTPPPVAPMNPAPSSPEWTREPLQPAATVPAPDLR